MLSSPEVPTMVAVSSRGTFGSALQVGGGGGGAGVANATGIIDSSRSSSQYCE